MVERIGNMMIKFRKNSLILLWLFTVQSCSDDVNFCDIEKLEFENFQESGNDVTFFLKMVRLPANEGEIINYPIFIIEIQNNSEKSKLKLNSFKDYKLEISDNSWELKRFDDETIILQPLSKTFYRLNLIDNYLPDSRELLITQIKESSISLNLSCTESDGRQYDIEKSATFSVCQMQY